MTDLPSDTIAEILLPADDLTAEMGFFQKTLGFRLDEIFPADDPAIAVVSGHGLRLRLQRGVNCATASLRVRSDDPAAFADGQTALTSPAGTRVEIVRRNPPLEIPKTRHQFVVRRLRDEAPWVIGRAGMHYRDLIPDRLGGSIIASHIRIPDGGPVPDMVHYHTVGFQLIYCYRGWVDLVYEDQGPPFRLHGGDCVIQPPEIRHRVLVASDNVEVVEIGVPAEHVTTIDHEMELPNGARNPDRRFQGQNFVHHKLSDATWTAWHLPGFEHRDTGINAGTNGVASVHVARAGETSTSWRHDGEIVFTFVLEGQLDLAADGDAPQSLAPGDAFVVPPDLAVRYTVPSAGVELLQVSLPGPFGSEVLAD